MLVEERSLTSGVLLEETNSPEIGFAYYTGRVVKLRFFELGGDGRIGERWGAFVFQG